VRRWPGSVQINFEGQRLRHAQPAFADGLGVVQHCVRADRPKLRFGCPARLRGCAAAPLRRPHNYDVRPPKHTFRSSRVAPTVASPEEELEDSYSASSPPLRAIKSDGLDGSSPMEEK
jgi:hypothetical protein